VPRDGTATRDRLLREAERLFARHGLYRVTIREVTQAAGQRNASAVDYHFGSREGLIEAILARHGDPTDEARGKHLAQLGPDATSRDLLATLVVPYGAHLRTPEGRDYLRIVAQMTPAFSGWREPRAGTGPWLREILGLLEGRDPEVPVAIRRERVVEMMMLLTAAVAERARVIEEGEPLALDEAVFLADLTDVLAGVLRAPRSGRLSD
jgi:TetR/AcrR family transcriptional regulator, regulator of cefoperazone and chloramphenicol sensitivity